MFRAEKMMPRYCQPCPMPIFANSVCRSAIARSFAPRSMLSPPRRFRRRTADEPPNNATSR